MDLAVSANVESEERIGGTQRRGTKLIQVEDGRVGHCRADSDRAEHWLAGRICAVTPVAVVVATL